jgi:hypothetical protein
MIITGHFTYHWTFGICNVGIPIAMAVSSNEDSQLYELFHTTVAKALNVQLAGFHPASDQRPALRSVCRPNRNRQFLCLWHFLISLKQKRWSFHVGNLFRCRGSKDFETLMTIFESVLLEASAAEQLTAQKMLEKAGLTLVDGKIDDGNVGRWNAVSMISCAQTRLQ